MIRHKDLSNVKKTLVKWLETDIERKKILKHEVARLSNIIQSR